MVRRISPATVVGSLLIAGAVGCGRGPSGGSSDPASITAAGIETHTRILGDDSLQGRGTGQPGYEHAARYVADQFKRLGLAPGGSGGTYLQSVPLRETRLSTAAITVTRAGKATVLELDRDFVASGDLRDSSISIEGGVVFVGYGVTAPAFQHDDYAGLDVKGKIVAVLMGGPPSLPANPRAHYGGSEKSVNAAAHGAIAMITVRQPEIETLFPWAFTTKISRRPSMYWLDGPGALPADFPILPSAMLSGPASAALFAGAPTPWAAAVAAANGTDFKPVPLAVKLRLSKTSRIRELAAPNVVGSLAGSDPALRGESVVFTAHLDHDGIGEPVAGDSIYNGVVDNAASVAALLEIAKAFTGGAKPKRSLLFVATTAEEHGLLGAYYFAAHPTVPLGSIVADLNMDGNHMLFPTKSVIALGAEQSSLGAAAAEAAKSVGLELETELMPEQAFFTRSDQYPFVRKGVPSLFFVNGTRSSDSTVNGTAVLGKWLLTIYHSPKDDLSQPIVWESGAKYAREVYAVGRIVANAPQRPQWTAGDFFGTTFGSKTGSR